MHDTKRDLEWLLFQKKRLIGSFCVQINCGNGYDQLYDVGQITSVYTSDSYFTLKVDDNTWMLYSWGLTLPDVSEDDNSITVHDKVCDVKFLILKPDRKK